MASAPNRYSRTGQRVYLTFRSSNAGWKALEKDSYAKVADQELLKALTNDVRKSLVVLQVKQHLKVSKQLCGASLKAALGPIAPILAGIGWPERCV